MFKVGKYPFYECSTRGDKRFSAFCAFIKSRGNTIENLYQAAKVFENGETNLHWRAAKGRKPVNSVEVHKFYVLLWNEYFDENPELLEVIRDKSGFSDLFGKPGSVCQAAVIYRIQQERCHAK